MSNKKMFNIVAEFELSKKPNWLDDFRKKYDKPYDYHIALKNCTYFNKDDLRNIKLNLKKVLEPYNKIKVVFNDLFINSASKGECIMIRAEKNETLMRLQKELSDEFSKYGEYVSEEARKFENNFEPHITIARHLSPEQLNNAKKELKEDTYCEAIIYEIVLTIAKDDIFEEWSNPNNETLFSLN